VLCTRCPHVVIVLVIAIYFLLFAGFAGLIIHAPARDAVLRTAERVAVGLISGSRFGLSEYLFHPLQTLLAATVRCSRWIALRRRIVGLAMLAVITPSLLVAWLLDKPIFDFAETYDAPDRKIALLLTGEQLSAPPPLPPEIFTTREVELIRPATAWASRDWALLDDDFRQRLLSLFKVMREDHGYELVMLEGYRSPERQAALAALGTSVTQAGPGMSYHQYGLAADCAFLRDGQLVISEQDPWAMRGYQIYGELADRMGLTWGGRWRMRDYGHVEFRRPGTRPQVAARH